MHFKNQIISKERVQDLADYIKELRNLVGNTKVIMVVAGVFVFNETHQLLLHRRIDNEIRRENRRCCT